MDTKVIVTRLQKLESYVQHLRDLQQAVLEEYLDDENLQAIVERRLQLSIQVCMDIASYLIAQLGLQSPEEPENVFVVLGRERVLSSALADRMVGMVRFRNILVHDYFESRFTPRGKGAKKDKTALCLLAALRETLNVIGA